VWQWLSFVFVVVGGVIYSTWINKCDKPWFLPAFGYFCCRTDPDDGAIVWREKNTTELLLKASNRITEECKNNLNILFFSTNLIRG